MKWLIRKHMHVCLNVSVFVYVCMRENVVVCMAASEYLNYV